VNCVCEVHVVRRDTRVYFGARFRPKGPNHWHRLFREFPNPSKVSPPPTECGEFLWDIGCNFRPSKRSILPLKIQFWMLSLLRTWPCCARCCAHLTCCGICTDVHAKPATVQRADCGEFERSSKPHMIHYKSSHRSSYIVLHRVL
jgi:hypothetical protein